VADVIQRIAENGQSSSQELPLVTIGLPVFNGARYMRAALDRLLAQDYPNFELIISDNASTDQTAEICLEYGARDSRIRYFRNDTNLGAVRNFNRVFELASGKYFMWAAHDDWWDDSYVRKCVEPLERNPDAVICGSYFKVIDEVGRPAKGSGQYFVEANAASRARRVGQLLWFVNPAFSMYSLIRSEALAKTRMLQSVWGGDLILITELCLIGPILAIPEFLFRYRTYAAKSFKNIATTLDPANKDRAFVVLWKELYIEVLKTVWQHPLGGYERAKVLMAASLTLATHWWTWFKLSLNDHARFKYLLPAVENRDKGNRKLALYYSLRSMLSNPLFLFSFGVWSIVCEAIIGRRRADSARRLFRRFFPRRLET
jgi:glycosyltransferase involved in cell wall biosynthesis